MKFLDIGAGLGFFSCEAAKRGAQVTAVDIGPKLLKIISQRCKVKSRIGDAQNLPFKTSSFDYCLLTEVIEHTTNPQLAISEAVRVLKPGGFLILTSPNKIWKYLFLFLTFLKIRPYQGLENWQRSGDIRNQLIRSGMKVRTEIGFNPLPPTPGLVRKFLINYGFLATKK